LGHFLLAQRYAGMRNRDRNVSVCPSVMHRYSMTLDDLELL